MTIKRTAIALEKVDGTEDLFLREDGTLAIVEDAEAVGQHARQRMLTYEGEWFLDRSAGLPWLTQILGLKFDPDLYGSVVKGCLAETDGVQEITTFSVRFDQSLREISGYDIEVVTDYGLEVSL